MRTVQSFGGLPRYVCPTCFAALCSKRTKAMTVIRFGSDDRIADGDKS